METTGLKLTDLQRSYIAAYLDAEGCVSFYNTLRVRVTNTHLPTLKMLQELLGGSLHRCKRQKSRHRSQFQWGVSGYRARALCAELLPFLFEKRAQAEVGLECGEYPVRSTSRRVRIERLKGLKRVDYGCS